MRNPKLESIAKMLDKGSDFELTALEYKRKTGADFPKDKYYAEKRSAIAREAAKHGFRIEVVPQRIKFQRLLDSN